MEWYSFEWKKELPLGLFDWSMSRVWFRAIVTLALFSTFHVLCLSRLLLVTCSIFGPIYSSSHLLWWVVENACYAENEHFCSAATVPAGIDVRRAWIALEKGQKPRTDADDDSSSSSSKVLLVLCYLQDQLNLNQLNWMKSSSRNSTFPLQIVC